MEQIPSPFSGQKVYPFNNFSVSAVLSGDNEFFLLRDDINIIYGYRISPYGEIYRIFTQSHKIQKIWYVKSHDTILYMDFNEDLNETQIRLLFNWRPAEQKNNIGVTVVPEELILPNKWHFPFPRQNKFETFLLASFKKSENPTCEVYNNSIFIISESTIIIWDLFDRPVLRTIILLPLSIQSQRPLFSFRGERLALVTKGILFIIKISENEPEKISTPFSTGSNCLKLEENKIVIDFGLSQEGQNILFIERHLPERKISIQITFQLTVPGIPKGVKFLSDKLILFINNEVILGCIRKLTNNGKEIYDPAKLRDSNGDFNQLYNQNYVIFYNNDHLDIIPNPTKSNIDFSNGTIGTMSNVNLPNITNICMDDKRCIITTSSKNKLNTRISNSTSDRKEKSFSSISTSTSRADINSSTLYILDFEDVQKLTDVAIKSPSVEGKMIGIRLLDHNDSHFASTAYEIGFQLLEQSRKAEAVPFLIEAFNKGSKENRQAILTEISKFDSKSLQKHRLLFVEGAEFKGGEITDTILQDIMKLDNHLAAIKLIQAHKFESNIQFSNSTEGNLFQAIKASICENHEKAKELFLQIDESHFSTLDDVILQKISKDLKPAVLVRLRKPEFDNDEWSLSERYASFYFMNKIASKAIEYASDDDQTTWHFSQWPTPPKLCNWIKGNEKMQFIACCVSMFNISNIPNLKNEALSKLIDGINLAKNEQYKNAVDTFGDDIYPIHFLRYFANTSAKWVKILQQFSENEEIHQVATHFLILNSPKGEFYSAIEPIKNLPEFSDVFSKLKSDDNSLIQLLSVDQ